MVSNYFWKRSINSDFLGRRIGIHGDKQWKKKNYLWKHINDIVDLYSIYNLFYCNQFSWRT